VSVPFWLWARTGENRDPSTGSRDMLETINIFIGPA
jgi:hypothetical protein